MSRYRYLACAVRQAFLILRIVDSGQKSALTSIRIRTKQVNGSFSYVLPLAPFPAANKPEVSASGMLFLAISGPWRAKQH
ncbi:hypothetical protein [Mycoavidus sp. SF9855]|uniref:hypothetical protein n=1 Tax=Mycoavidus sp. SF9855 TaxID=2968475 RepID=UPI00211C3A03|nr:hypothetical protein [Mycoavidus sp. SF9855]UUM21389.1 hypothetical protein NQD60_08155 [Mycoavidus sp. SF9855]